MPWTGERGIVESVDQIMARDAESRGMTGGTKPVLIRPDRSNLPEAPECLGEVSHWPIGVPGTGATIAGLPNYPSLSRTGGPFHTRNPQPLGVSFITDGYVSGNPFPPDTTGDLGPTQILTTTNSAVRVYSKSGQLGALSTTLDGFFASVRGSIGTSDPHCTFDRTTGRWFVVAITVSSPNRVLIAMSQPMTNTVQIGGQSTFTFFQFTQSAVVPLGNIGQLADYPCAAVDVNALYIGCDMFSASGLVGTTGWVVRKGDLMATVPTLTVTVFRGMSGTASGIATPRGVTNDDLGATEGYFIGPDVGTRGRLLIHRVRNPGGSPTLDPAITLGVPSTARPVNLATQGASMAMDVIDDRLFDARMFRNRATGQRTLWTAHTIRVSAAGVGATTGTRNGGRWYEIGGLAGTPVLRQSGTMFDSATTNPVGFIYPTIAMNGQGHAAIGVTSGGATEHLQVSVAGRLSTDVLGLTQARTVAVPSTTAYNAGLNRWGDYSATVVDPADDQTIWTFQEYSGTNLWACRAVQLLAPPPAIPVECEPGFVGVGTTASIVVTGLFDAGSGFHDTDPASPSYVHHLTASVSGLGVSVTGVSFDPADPLHVTLAMTVDATAPPGPRNVTIVNPDGQSTTGINLLSIADGCLAPGVFVQPTPSTTCVGGNAAFAIRAYGSAIGYQWRRDMIPLSGATASTLTFAPVTLADAGSYDCVVTNACGTAASNAAALAVQSPAVVTSQPVSQMICEGGSVVLAVGWSGSVGTIQWRRNLAAIPGAIGTSLTIGPVAASNVGSYDAVLSGQCGTVTSAPATVAVCRVDMDCSGTINAQDIFRFLELWFASDPRAEFNGDGHLDVPDIYSYLGAWFAGCS